MGSVSGLHRRLSEYLPKNCSRSIKTAFFCSTENFGEVNFSKTLRFSDFFGRGTKTFRNWRKKLAGLSRLHLTCPEEIREVVAGFPNFFKVSISPEFRELKKWLLAENIRHVCTKLYFTCPEEFFEEILSLETFLVFKLFSYYGEQYCIFSWKSFRPSFKNLKLTFFVSRRTVWGRTSVFETRY